MLELDLLDRNCQLQRFSTWRSFTTNANGTSEKLLTTMSSTRPGAEEALCILMKRWPSP
jgi:hypothetical protein